MMMAVISVPRSREAPPDPFRGSFFLFCVVRRTPVPTRLLAAMNPFLLKPFLTSNICRDNVQKTA